MLLNKLIDILHKQNCSLVLEDTQGNIRLCWKQGVRDLEDLLNNEPDTLRCAIIADKVVGKAAAGMMAFGGVTEVYAEVLSKKAIPLLDANDISYSYGVLVDHIIIKDGDTRCHLERIVEPAQSAAETVGLLRRHFEEMLHNSNTKLSQPQSDIESRNQIA